MAVGHQGVAHAGATQRCEVSATAESLADVACQGANVGAFAAHHTHLQGGLGWKSARQYLNFVDDERLRTDFHVFTFACQLVGRFAIHFASAELGWHLLNGAHKLALQHLVDLLARDVLPRILGINLGFEVERWGGGTQSDVGNVFLHAGLQLLDLLGHSTGAHNEHASGKGVESASVAHFHVARSEHLTQSATHLFHYGKRSPAQWLVHAEHFAFYRVEHI